MESKSRRRRNSSLSVMRLENYEDELVDSRPPSTGRSRQRNGRDHSEAKQPVGNYRESRRERRRNARGSEYKRMGHTSVRSFSPRTNEGQHKRFHRRRESGGDNGSRPTSRERPNSRERSSSRDRPRSRERTGSRESSRGSSRSKRDAEYKKNRHEQMERIHLEKEKSTSNRNAQIIGDMELNGFENFRAYVRELILEKGLSNRREIMVDCVDFVGRKLKAYESDFLTAFLKKHNNGAWGQAGPRKETGDSDSDDDEIYMIPSLKSEYIDRRSKRESKHSESKHHESETSDDDGSSNNKVEPKRSKPENLAELIECLGADKMTRREFLMKPLPKKLGLLQGYVERVDNNRLIYFLDPQNYGNPKNKEGRIVVLEAVRRRAFNKPLAFFFNDFGKGSPNDPAGAVNGPTAEDIAAFEAASAQAAAEAAKSGKEYIKYDITSFPYLGKIRADFTKSNFVLFDNGGNPKDLVGKRANERPRAELLRMNFKHNIGINRPKNIELLLPAVDNDETGDVAEAEPLLCRPMNKRDGLKRWKQELPDCISTFVNKRPEYDEEQKRWVLSFGGRVTAPSVKNFQLVERALDNTVASKFTMQFGRRQTKHCYALDFSYPMTPLQAFGSAVAIILN